MQQALSAWIARRSAPGFWQIYRFDRALRRKLTPAGWLIASLLIASAVFGLNTKETLIYQLFGLSLGLLVVAALSSYHFSPPITISRALPRVATAGVEFEYALTVKNLGDKPYEALEMAEVLESERPDARQFAAFKAREDRTRNFFDRLVGYPRWVSLMRLTLGAHIEAPALPALAARGQCSIALRCLPLRRGVLNFGAVRLARSEPCGLMKANWSLPLAGTLLVMPRTYPVAPLELAGSRRLQPGGVAFAGRIGDAEEFVSLRDYRAGDTPRRIHWKAWARTGRPVVKEYQDEFFVRHALVLDTFPSGDEARFETAVSLAASFVMMPRSSESLLDLMFVEKRAYTLTQGRGLGAAADLLRVLAAVSVSRQGSFDTLAEVVLLSAARISGGICVLLAWDEPRQRLVARLRARGIPLRVWVVRDDGEREALDPGPMASDRHNLRVVDHASLAAELARP